MEVTTDREQATLILHASDVNQKVNDDKTGTRLAKALLGIPTLLPANVSVELLELDGNVLWAYNCVKAQSPNHNVQSLSEAIAKHLKNYLESTEAHNNPHY